MSSVDTFHPTCVSRRQIQNVTNVEKLLILLNFITIFGIAMEIAFK